jgi:hypothetical protein
LGVLAVQYGKPIPSFQRKPEYSINSYRFTNSVDVSRFRLHYRASSSSDETSKEAFLSTLFLDI